MELLKLLNSGEIIAQMISFLLLFLILRAFAWKPILKLLDDRKARIAGEFKAIEEAKQYVERLKQDYQVKLDSSASEAAKIMKQALEDGKKLSEEFRQNAYRDAQQIIDKAQAEIKHELAKARLELKNQIVELSLGAAESVIRERLTADSDRKIVENFIDKIEAIE